MLGVKLVCVLYAVLVSSVSLLGSCTQPIKSYLFGVFSVSVVCGVCISMCDLARFFSSVCPIFICYSYISSFLLLDLFRDFTSFIIVEAHYVRLWYLLLNICLYVQAYNGEFSFLFALLI